MYCTSMHVIDEKKRKIVATHISPGSEIVLIAYSFLENSEQIVKYILHELFVAHKKEDLLDPVFSCIKELTTNAIKANIKRLLIEEGLINNPDDPHQLVKGIKAVLNERSMLEYGLKLKEKDLSMRLHLNITDDTLTVRVIDPMTLNEAQYQRMCEKIERAKEYENLAMCYLENPDPLAEGMGLGLSMIVVLLKGSGVDPKHFHHNKRSKCKKNNCPIYYSAFCIKSDRIKVSLFSK